MRGRKLFFSHQSFAVTYLIVEEGIALFSTGFGAERHNQNVLIRMKHRDRDLSIILQGFVLHTLYAIKHCFNPHAKYELKVDFFSVSYCSIVSRSGIDFTNGMNESFLISEMRQTNKKKCMQRRSGCPSNVLRSLKSE